MDENNNAVTPEEAKPEGEAPVVTPEGEAPVVTPEGDTAPTENGEQTTA